ncbi:hypothetical protein HYQ46_006060 [Verticillium longisporum]|nr:hypothetical protein HYQ46_006060 [Verticillium longisporum]
MSRDIFDEFRGDLLQTKRRPSPEYISLLAQWHQGENLSSRLAVAGSREPLAGICAQGGEGNPVVQLGKSRCFLALAFEFE